MKKERRMVLLVTAVVIAAAVATVVWQPTETSVPLPAPSSRSTNGTGSGVQIVAQNLEVPWAIDFAADGTAYFTERPGRIRMIEPNGTLVKEPVAYINAEANGEAGLLGLALDPNFTSNHMMYVYHTYSNGTAVFNKVLALKEQDNKIISSKVLIDKIPAADRNDGGILKFGPDGKLYISTGDARQPELAQNAKSLAGKILRINSDGSIPPDNPFEGSPVYSYGHRNIEGMAWDPVTKAMYASEHGDVDNDEINVIKPGKNYGWPIEQCDATRFEKPILCFNPAIAPAGMVIPSSNALGYKGSIILATLRGEHLRQIDLASGVQSNILTGFGRLRDVAEAPDGSLYVLTSDRDGRAIPSPGDDKIIRLTRP
ncbi:MAG: PQQ-dependent sugar dehydrogenase [Nitrososphaera sp.]|jgi:glucose/arabinose dehydrogenase